jgi:hypothetical protein
MSWRSWRLTLRSGKQSTQPGHSGGRVPSLDLDNDPDQRPSAQAQPHPDANDRTDPQTVARDPAPPTTRPHDEHDACPTGHRSSSRFAATDHDRPP